MDISIGTYLRSLHQYIYYEDTKNDVVNRYDMDLKIWEPYAKMQTEHASFRELIVCEDALLYLVQTEDGYILYIQKEEEEIGIALPNELTHISGISGNYIFLSYPSHYVVVDFDGNRVDIEL